MGVCGVGSGSGGVLGVVVIFDFGFLGFFCGSVTTIFVSGRGCVSGF